MYRSCLLTTEHKLARFDCGVPSPRGGTPSCNKWLTGHALRAQIAGSARTFVWTPASQPQDVVAYFSLAPTVVTQGSVSRSMAGGVSQIPAYLIGKLALDRTLHRQGLGAQLLVNALEIITSVAERGGGSLIVVSLLTG